MSAIRGLAERLDGHRKAAQGRGATITGMYNLLAKLRAGEAFTHQERDQHEVAQTEILRKLHDELDIAVAAAYGWPVDLGEAETLLNLLALNKERAAEEARGVVRWLRPEYQAPPSVQPFAKPIFEPEPEEVEASVVATIGTQPWPRDLKEQLAALRTLVLGSARLWTLEEIGDAFKSRGRYREGISSHLDLLTDLGVITLVEAPQGQSSADRRRWGRKRLWDIPVAGSSPPESQSWVSSWVRLS